MPRAGIAALRLAGLCNTNCHGECHACGAATPVSGSGSGPTAAQRSHPKHVRPATLASGNGSGKDNCSTTQPSQACTNTVRIKHTVTHARNERRAFGGGSEQDVLAFVAAAAMRPYSGGHLHVPRRRGQHTKTETVSCRAVSCRAESVASRSIMITASGNVAAWIRARFFKICIIDGCVCVTGRTAGTLGY